MRARHGSSLRVVVERGRSRGGGDAAAAGQPIDGRNQYRWAARRCLLQKPACRSRFRRGRRPDARLQPTKAWLFWQPERLLFAFQVHDEEIIAAPPSNRESDVDPQDRVELFLWSGDKSDTYWCVEVGAIGAVHDYAARFYRKFDQAWSPAGMQVVVARTATGYCVEGELSRAALEKMGFALCAEESVRCGLFRADFTAARPKDPTWICWVDAGEPNRFPRRGVVRPDPTDRPGRARARSGDDPPEARKVNDDNNVLVNDQQPPSWQPDAGLLVMRMGDRQLEVSLSCPGVRLEDGAGSFGGDVPTKVEPGGQNGGGWECSYPPVRLASGAVLDRAAPRGVVAAGGRVAQVAAVACPSGDAR